MRSTIVIEDEPGVRADGIRVLDHDAAVRVVGQAGTVHEAADVVRRHRPDVVFVTAYDE